jgi:hypothetical protein
VIAGKVTIELVFQEIIRVQNIPFTIRMMIGKMLGNIL